jgi:hypothetical protein
MIDIRLRFRSAACGSDGRYDVATIWAFAQARRTRGAHLQRFIANRTTKTNTHDAPNA